MQVSSSPTPEVEMLLLLIAVPVVTLAAFTHKLLQAYAPSNVLIRCVRTSRPTIGAAAALCVLALGCVAAVHAISLAIATGAPGWLNLVVLVLAWDAIKFFGMVALLSLRLLRISGRPRDGRGSGTSTRYRRRADSPLDLRIAPVPAAPFDRWSALLSASHGQALVWNGLRVDRGRYECAP
jgi:hypothetical protein